MTKASIAISAGLPLLILTSMIVPAMMMASMVESQRVGDLRLASSCTTNTSDLTIDDLDNEQLENANVIIRAGQSLGVSARGLTIAIAAAFQESALRNLDHGDRDSLGLFQQRPSAGWGRPDQLTDPEYAARSFFGGPNSPARSRGLLDVKGWEDMPLWEAAQSVQRSGFPTAYADWEGLADDVVTKLASIESTCRTLAAGPWKLPIEGRYELTSGFGRRKSPMTGMPDFHTGQDFSGSAGTQVMAGAAGLVTWAGSDGTYGNLVRIQHADGVETYYAHLSSVRVSRDDEISEGTPLGEVGSTGNSTGPHLHFEVRLNGEPTDPVAFLQEKGLDP